MKASQKAKYEFPLNDEIWKCLLKRLVSAFSTSLKMPCQRYNTQTVQARGNRGLTKGESPMKSTTVVAFAVCLLASLAVVGTVSAQDHVARATVPFGFNVGDKWVPPGTYTITSDSGSPNNIFIRSKDSNVTLVTLAQPDSQPSNGAKLVFTKYGDQYFLHEILCSACGMNVSLFRSKHERIVRKRLEAGLSNSSDVYLALR